MWTALMLAVHAFGSSCVLSTCTCNDGALFASPLVKHLGRGSGICFQRNAS